MFNSKISSLLFLKRNYLEYYSASGKDVLQLEFPPNLISELEVLDKDSLVQFIKKSLREGGLPAQKTLLVLSSDLLFEELLPVVNINHFEESNFFKNVPIKPSQCSKLKVLIDQKTYLFAANKELYLSTVEAFVDLGWEIVGVTPVSIYHKIDDGTVLSTDEIEQIMTAFLKFPQANFLQEQDYFPKTRLEDTIDKNKPEHKIPIKKSLLSLLTTFILLGVFLISTLSSGYLILKMIKTRSQALSEKPVASVSSPLPTPQNPLKDSGNQAVNKSDLKIQVLNGSGIPGQASRIQTQLAGLGFTQIETGNSQEPILGSTAVFSRRVTKEVQDEVRLKIRSLLANLSETDSLEAPVGIDILITTGK